MIRPDSLTLKEFEGPFQPTMEETNRWVRLSQYIPWSELARVYETQLSATQGRPAKRTRLVIGAMIIKHKLALSDRETVCQATRQNNRLRLHCLLRYANAWEQELFDGFQQAIVNALQSSGAKPGFRNKSTRSRQRTCLSRSG